MVAIVTTKFTALTAVVECPPPRHPPLFFNCFSCFVRLLDILHSLSASRSSECTEAPIGTFLVTPQACDQHSSTFERPLILQRFSFFQFQIKPVLRAVFPICTVCCLLSSAPSLCSSPSLCLPWISLLWHSVFQSRDPGIVLPLVLRKLVDHCSWKARGTSSKYDQKSHSLLSSFVTDFVSLSIGNEFLNSFAIW